jgi:hypothetical protein
MPQKPTPEEVKLKSSIQEAIKEIAADKELQKVKSLSRHNPMKARRKSSRSTTYNALR